MQTSWRGRWSRRACAAIAAASIAALLGSAHGARAGGAASVYALAGNASTVTYGSYPYSHAMSLNDVTVGSNFTPSSVCGYLCTASPGYDGPTGLGTPNGVGGF